MPQVNIATMREALRAFREVARRQTGDPLSQVHLGSGLGHRSAHGALSTVTGQWTRLILQTASTVVLARLLTPEEFGLVAMVTALIYVGDALGNLGLSQSTVQTRELTLEQVNFFFWVQVTVGLVLTSATILLTPTIVDFYHQPRLASIATVMALSFLANGLAAQHVALLSRQMRFSLMSMMDVLGLLGGIIVAVAVAVAGGGVWAVVSLSLTPAIVRLIVATFASGWTPRRPGTAAGVAPMFRFGVNLTFTNILDYAAKNMDNVLVGRTFGPDVLGLYSRAYNLLLLPIRQVNGPVSRVAVPVLGYLQDQPDRYRKYYRLALSAIAYSALPILAILAATASAVIELMLGDDWLEATPIFQVLAIGGAVLIVGNTNSWLFISTGQTGRMALWALASRPVIVFGFFIGLPFGALGVAWGFAGANLLLVLPAFVVAVRGTPVRVVDIWLSTWRALLLSALVFSVGVVVTRELGSVSPWAVMGTSVGGMIVVMALAAIMWSSVRKDVRQILDVFLRPDNRNPSAFDDRAGEGQIRP